MGKTSHDILTHPNLSIKADTSQHVIPILFELWQHKDTLESLPRVKEVKKCDLALLPSTPEPPPRATTLPIWSHGVHTTLYNSRQQTEHHRRAPGIRKSGVCPNTPPFWPPGACCTGPPGPKFRCAPRISIYYNTLACLGPAPTFSKLRNYCARGCPPKSRISGHVNSRLMRGESKQGQTKRLSYYMGEGRKDKLKGKEGSNRRVTGAWRDQQWCIIDLGENGLTPLLRPFWETKYGHGWQSN